MCDNGKQGFLGLLDGKRANDDVTDVLCLGLMERGDEKGAAAWALI